MKQPFPATRSVVWPCTQRTAATAARVGIEMSNAVSSPAPSEITRETRSGRRWPSAFARCPPRLWPISASCRPALLVIRSARASSALIAVFEQPTFQAMPERCGACPIRSSQPAITDIDESPARNPGISITGPPLPRGTPLPA